MIWWWHALTDNICYFPLHERERLPEGVAEFLDDGRWNQSGFRWEYGLFCPTLWTYISVHGTMFSRLSGKTAVLKNMWLGSPMWIFFSSASQRFNLAVMDVVREDMDLFEKVRTDMVQLRTMLKSAKIWILTHLKAVLRCSNQCTWFYIMLRRYMQQREFLEDLEIETVDRKYHPAVRTASLK